ncbi:MAG: hypothetical protein ACHQRK_07410 [Gemmatimonadales bacterium]
MRMVVPYTERFAFTPAIVADSMTMPSVNPFAPQEKSKLMSAKTSGG